MGSAPRDEGRSYCGENARSGSGLESEWTFLQGIGNDKGIVSMCMSRTLALNGMHCTSLSFSLSLVPFKSAEKVVHIS